MKARTNKIGIGESLKNARLREGLTQEALASKIGVTQPNIAQWETNRSVPAKRLKALKKVLGEFLDNSGAQTEEASAFGTWLNRTIIDKKKSVPELAAASGITATAIYNIINGRSLNPQEETRRLLSKALGANIPDDVSDASDKTQAIEGLGSLTDFDPYNPSELPTVPGVYVFYDVSERPVYVGKADNISKRVKDHDSKFWFKRPIVNLAAFVEVRDQTLRHQIEQVLIKFLKSNAVINTQSVDRD